MSRLWKKLYSIKKIVLVFFYFILLLLLLISVLLFTHAGNQIAIKIAEHLEPRLSLELQQGSFFNSPVFSQISWLDQHNQIEIDSVAYQFDWSCLFNKICLQQLDISNAKIVIASSGTETVSEPEESTSGEFELPVFVLLQAINLNNIHFSVADTVVDLDSLHLQAEGQKKDLNVNSIIDGLTVTLPAKPETNVVNTPKPTKIPSSLPAILSQQDLPEISLPFNLFVDPLKITDFTLKEGKQTLLVVNSLNTRFNFQQSQLVIESMALDLPETDLQLAGDINFSATYPLNLQIKGELKSLKQLQPADQLDGQIYNLKSYGDLSQLKTELILSNKISLQLAAQVDLFERNLPHTLTLNWQQLRWPVTGKAAYLSESGALQSNGMLNDYQVVANALYKAEKIPEGELTLKGKGNLQEFNLEQLLVKTLDGTAKLNGLLKWQDFINWDGQLAIDKIDLAKLDTQYSGKFSGLIKQNVQVSLKQQETPSWKFTIPAMNINGQFLERPFAVNGHITGDDKKGIAFKDLVVKNAKNEIKVNGLLAKQNDLSIKLNIVDLSHALIGGSGRINGELKIQGTKDSLNIQSDLQGSSLSYQNTKLNAFQLVSETIVSDKPTLSLQFNANKLTLDKQIIDDIAIEISNIKNFDSVNEHQIDLSVKSQPVSTEMSIQLVQAKQAWFSRLSAATIDIPEQRLTLNNPFTVNFKNNDALISAHCWQFSNSKLSDSGEFCVNELSIGKQGKADLELDNYLLANLQPYLPEALKMAGAVSANAQIEWSETAKPTINLNLVSNDMLVTVDDIEYKGDEAVSYPVETFTIKLNSNQEKSDFQATVYSQNLIDAHIQGQLHPYQSKPSVNAVIDIELPDFSPFMVLVPALEKLEGRSTTQLKVTGSLHNPEVSGQITIAETFINAVGLPIQFNRLNSSIVIANSSATVDGYFYTPEFDFGAGSETRKTLITDAVRLVDKSINKVRRVVIKDRSEEVQKPAELSAGEPGKVNIKGKLDWKNKLAGDIHIFANKMTVYQYDKFDLLVSPDLHLNFAEQIKLVGKIFVDRGKITVKELPEGAISPSQDVVVVDIKDAKDTSNIPIAVRLQLDLGQQLRVQALGLDSIVKGKLVIRKTTTKNPTINGQLQLVDGSYRAFAQQLVLRKSRITFQGPIASPYISIEAIRDPNKIEDSVTAGVQVSGTPDQLSLEIFSEPAMAQQDALSYIIRGKSLQSSSDGQGNSQITSMLISLSANKSAGVMNKIGNKIGIKDLSLSASGSGDEQSVGVSGYIAPGVELSYGVGVFDNFSVLAIRYEMFERFYIEASSGLEQAIDAYYEFDWD